MTQPVYTSQVFQNLQNVNQNNMNLLYQDKDEKLSAYFDTTPCICGGIGTYINYFGQVGSTNVFNFEDGVIRFIDQASILSSEILTTFASMEATEVTVTASSSPPGQLYVVAILTQTQLDAYKVQNTVVISPTAMTLAQIAGQTNPTWYVPLFKITHTGSNYIVSLDSSCTINYGRQFDSTTGVRMLPDGSIEQFGTGTILASGDSVAGLSVTFPVKFPNGIKIVNGNANGPANNPAGFLPTFCPTSITTSGFLANIDTLGATTINQSVPFSWHAIGY